MLIIVIKIFKIQRKVCIDTQNEKTSIKKICVASNKKYFRDNQTADICSQQESLCKH